MIYTCEEQVLKALGISTFKNIPEKNFRTYILLTNDVADDLRISIIRQNPGLIFLTAGFIRNLNSLYRQTFTIQPERFESIIEALSHLRQNLELMGQKPVLSDAQIKSIADTQCMLAYMYFDVDHKAYLLVSKLIFGSSGMGLKHSSTSIYCSIA